MADTLHQLSRKSAVVPVSQGSRPRRLADSH